VTPVLGLDEATEHGHNVARAGFPTGPDGERHVAPAPRFSRTPGTIRSGGPNPGADTDAVLGEIGLADELVRLREAGAFGAP
jgi:alpha-methylacyl-CoA racemase